jgi:hypothetical protein
MSKALLAGLALIVPCQAHAQTSIYGSYTCQQYDGAEIVGHYDLQLNQQNAVIHFTAGDRAGTPLVFPIVENTEQRVSWRLSSSATEVLDPRTLRVEPEMLFPFVPADAEQRTRLLEEFQERYPRSQCLRAAGAP